MVRAPCCEKMGMKKGPWSSEEDQVLVSFIHHNGHANWRALPKLAGLSRCGKSCRLRWMNYLRPDIKRGNFSKEEEETIIELHQMLGNRWSAIAAKLPGRTDNEIKNVWHTHLKKKLKNTYQNPQDFKRQPAINNRKCDSNELTRLQFENPSHNSPQVSTSELSSVTEISVMLDVIKEEQMYSNEITFSEIDENFWSDELIVEDTKMEISQFSRVNVHDEYLQAQRICTGEVDDDTRFWYNLFIGEDGDLVELPGF